MNDPTTFSNLSLSDKYQYISDNGKYIGVRSYYNQFYELWYFRTGNKIERIEPLTDLSKLDLYINHMNSIDPK
jgi:hypothetical protein